MSTGNLAATVFTHHKGHRQGPGLGDYTVRPDPWLSSAMLCVFGPVCLACRPMALLPGSPPGKLQMVALGRDEVDALATGEINEWETCEQVRDANRAGRPAGSFSPESDEARIVWLVERLSERVPGVPIIHVLTGEPFRVVRREPG